MKKVFVSGCYDILHAGHVQFFEDAKALGDYLIVCFASDEVLMLAKKRLPSIPQDNKLIILKSIKSIDHVVTSSDLHPIIDFAKHIEDFKPDILAVTEDDKNIEIKQLGKWISHQYENYKKNENIMKDENIRKCWKEFTTKYKQYFV